MAQVQNYNSGWRNLLRRLPQGDQLPRLDWNRRHTGVRVLLGVQIVALGAYAVYQGLPLLHITWEVGGLLALLALASIPQIHRRVQSVFASAGLITCSALLTHLSGGYIEAHFHFFVMLGVIVLYEDWVPFSLSIAYVAIHHGVVGTLDPRSVYNHPDAFANPWIWAAIHAVFILWLSAALIIYWRISERLRAKTDLVMRSSATGIVGLDERSRITFANPSAARLLEVSTDDLIGRPVDEFLTIPAPHAAGRQGSRTLATLRPKTGPTLPVEVSTSTAAPGVAEVERVLTFTDIRERVEAQRNLQASEERFRSLSACSPVGIFLTNNEGETTYMNPRAAEICGIDLNDGLRQETLIQAVHPEDREGITGQWQQYVSKTQSRDTALPFHDEVRLLTPKTGARWVSVRAAPLFNDQGRILGHVGTLEDVTDRRESTDRLHSFNKELEERVHERTRELELTLKELESFNYSVSHDLRSPLRVISGYSELLLENVGGSLSRDNAESLREIYDATTRMNRTVEALLHLSTINRARIQKERINLTRIAQTTVDQIQRETPDRPVRARLQPELADDADPELVSIVLQNLFGNAWKFTRGRPDPEVWFGAIPTSKGNVYFVRDNGVGFESQEAGKLFRAFQRLHDKEEFEGSGIGLATVSRIVTRHGGNARAVGAVDQGAAFLFTLSAVPIPDEIQHPRDLDRYEPTKTLLA